MKPFLSKVLVFLSLQSLIVTGIISFLDKRHDLPFVSNSISYNAKAKYLAANRELLEKSRIKVIGSSMSLNNIDCQMLSDSLSVPVINLAAWKMKLSDYTDFDIWKKGTVIIMNMHFTDFGGSSLVPKKGFPYGGNGLTNFTNILSDFKTYHDNILQFSEFSSSPVNNNYESLNFDRTGTVVFTEHDDFRIEDGRWKGELNEYNEENLKAFIRDVSTRAPLVDKLIISFSPPISEKKNDRKSKSLLEIEQALSRIPNVDFINGYHSDVFNDKDFVDYCHFSNSGARKMTNLLISHIRERKILP
jgi:lysophospholipase L1-like esterase